MPAINYIASAAPTVNLALRNWTDRAQSLANLTSWWTLHSGRWTTENGRIVGCAPRAGSQPLTKAAASLGPLPATRYRGRAQLCRFYQ